MSRVTRHGARYCLRGLFLFSGVLGLLLGGGPKAQALHYDWNTDHEGFRSLAPQPDSSNPGWHRQDTETNGNWGVKGDPTLSKYEFITDLHDSSAISAFNAFLFASATYIEDLIIDMDVYKFTEAVWKAGAPRVDVWLSYGGKGYHFGSQLSGSNDWERDIRLSFIEKAYYTGAPLAVHIFTGFDAPNPNSPNGEYGIDLKIDNLRLTPVPEPATILLIGSGLAGLAAFRRKHRKR